MARHRPSLAWLLAGVVLGTACTGEVVGNTDSPPPSPPPTGGNPPPRTPTPPPSAPTGPVAGFQVPKSVKLLPFSVRMSRIASVTGVPVTDAVYDTLRENRLLLGDHDYANAKPPQESWSAARLTTWVESVRPVCQAPAVQTRYSPMPAKLALLVEASYGRTIRPEDTAAFDEGVRGLSLTPAKVVEIACISVLSSLEFVAQ
jgi:hypothetical protein